MSLPVAERIRRLLLLVPYAARTEEGVPVDELAGRLGVSPAALLDEIDFLLLVGKPPFSPADFLDVYVEGDRVHVALSQSFVRPPRLTHDEALALAIGAESLLRGETGEWGEALSRVLEKIEDAMTDTERERYHALEKRIVLGGGAGAASEVHGVLRAAVETRTRVTMSYFSAHRDAFGERTVEPYGIVASRGYWYLVAGPDGEDGYKIYRMDRARDARLEGGPGAYEVPASLDLSLLRPGRFVERPGEARIRVRVAPSRARWVRERFPEAEPGPNGSLEVRLDGAGWDFVSSFVLSLGGDATVIEPASLRERVAADARKILARYQA